MAAGWSGICNNDLDLAQLSDIGGDWSLSVNRALVEIVGYAGRAIDVDLGSGKEIVPRTVKKLVCESVGVATAARCLAWVSEQAIAENGDNVRTASDIVGDRERASAEAGSNWREDDANDARIRRASNGGSGRRPEPKRGIDCRVRIHQ